MRQNIPQQGLTTAFRLSGQGHGAVDIASSAMHVPTIGRYWVMIESGIDKGSQQWPSPDCSLFLDALGRPPWDSADPLVTGRQMDLSIPLSSLSSPL